MRLFIGIDIPENIKRKVMKIQEKLSNFDIKLVEPENLHFCLKFLGEVDEKNIENIEKTIEFVSNNFKAFEVSLDGLGFFPNNKYIRVIFLQITNGLIMKLIAKQLDYELSKYGFKQEKREFIPHLTLGRIKNLKNKEEFFNIIKNIKIEHEKFIIDEIKLYSSKLTSKGPLYSVIYSRKLL